MSFIHASPTYSKRPMKALYKKLVSEDKFARHYYCNSNRFIGKIKKANNKKVRRALDKWDIREV